MLQYIFVTIPKGDCKILVIWAMEMIWLQVVNVLLLKSVKFRLV